MKSRLSVKDLDIVYFHAGKYYREHPIRKLEEMCVTCETPLKNLGIGRQLA